MPKPFASDPAGGRRSRYAPGNQTRRVYPRTRTPAVPLTPEEQEWANATNPRQTSFYSLTGCGPFCPPDLQPRLNSDPDPADSPWAVVGLILVATAVWLVAALPHYQ